MNGALCALAAIVVLCPPALAQDSPWNRYTLEELDGVHVRVESTDACLQQGVSPDEVRATAEVALAEAGIPVLTESAMLETPGLPELRIGLACATAGDAVGYAVTVRVQQAVQMIRDTQITLPEGVTWFTESVGVAGRAEVARAMAATLDAKLAAFASAFAAANAEEGAANHP